MHQFKVGLIVLCTAILVSCGGRANFTAQVSFGDSLSDVGTYKVGAVAALGGGQFTINSGDGTPTNWTEFTALKLGLSAPCAAVTGLDGLDGFAVMPPIVQVGCTGYAQGGARVTHSVGVGHKLTGGSNVTLGLLTTPVVTQINNHLATTVDHVFSGNEIVFVMAGANDLFFQAALN